MNVSKFGESLPMVTPSQALIREGVETRHSPSRTDEGIVQTTNNLLVVKTIVVRKSLVNSCRFESGQSHHV